VLTVAHSHFLFDSNLNGQMQVPISPPYRSNGVKMALASFEILSRKEQNDDDDFVCVIAYDGGIRVVAEIPRKKIDDLFQPNSIPQGQHRKIVRDNLTETFRPLIEGLYATQYSKGGNDVIRHIDFAPSKAMNSPPGRIA